jgi:TRAP transporter T-component
MYKYMPIKLFTSIVIVVSLSACSMNKMMVNASIPMIEGGMEAMNQESDLQLAEDSMPANISMLNGMIHLDPDNAQLHVYASQAYYGLSYGFNEDSDIERAERFYLRGLKHGLIALELKGLKDLKDIPIEELEKQLQTLDKDDVAALFWTASNWAKWIDLHRDSAEGLIQLPRPTAMMQRILELDETFYYGSAHMYFGVYYGSRAQVLGGNFKKSMEHFDKAREITDGRLLVADLLQAQYLSRQMFNREDFHDRLNRIIASPDDIYPELALLNQIAKRKAKLLMKKEAQWF